MNDDDNVATRHHKLFNREIVADKRPYFMIYRYSRLKSTYKKFYNDVRLNVATMLHKDLDDILTAENPSEDEQQIIDSFLRKSNVSIGSCVPNRICKLLESEFDALRKNFRKISTDFDNSIYKTNKPYSRKTYLALKKIYEVYTGRMKLFVEQGLSSDYEDVLTQYFKDQCDLICPDEETQCNCLVDFAYTNKNSKVSLWNLCGGQIIKNLLDKSNHEISYPVETDSEFGEFVYNGRNYSMVTSRIDTGEEVE